MEYCNVYNAKKVSEPHHFRILAPSALVPFSLLLLFLHNLGKAQIMEEKQKKRKAVSQATKRWELIQRERVDSGRPTLSKLTEIFMG